MNVDAQHIGKRQQSGYWVRAPQPTDALGHTLRGIFGGGQLPADFTRLLRRLEGVAH